MKLNIDKKSPVMVTGATGYVAGWIIKRLLEEGVTVHAAVRDPNNEAKILHLKELAEKYKGSIKFFAGDLLQESSYADAMQGCKIVFHTASPFFTATNDPVKDLVEPAKIGTRNVLEAVNQTPGIERVVLTSSCVAIYCDAIDVAKTPNGILTEEIWNTTSSTEHQPYSYSKTLAEKEAWQIHDQQKHWKLVVINPSFVVGAGTTVHPQSTTTLLIKQMGDGTMKQGVPRFGIGMVDVQDVAEAHLRAAYVEDASGRHIVSGHNTDFFEMTQVLRRVYGDKYPFPKKTVPKVLAWLLGPIIDKTITRKIVSRNVGHPWKADNSKSIQKLGMRYRPMEESLKSLFEQLIKAELIK